MNILKTALPTVIILEPQRYQDSRGAFMEMYHRNRYREAGIVGEFVQDNLSYSHQQVVRGLHYQLNNPQGKLVTVLRGSVLDVVVDIRHGSPHFGQAVAIELNEANHRQVYIPPGFAHGFCTLSAEVIFHYKCTVYYNPQDEYGIHWCDDQLNLPWPQRDQQLVSPKDAAWPLLRNIPLTNLPRYS